MLAVLSPAKSLDLTPSTRAIEASEPRLGEDIDALAAITRALTPDDLRALMGISPKLADLNHERFQRLSRPFTPDNAKPALLTFAGDTYAGLKAHELDDDALRWAHDHIGILSGLYGVLRPLDLMQPYRLEMGTRLATPRGKNLYAFWGDRVTRELDRLTAGHTDRTVVNLASTEYSKVVQPDRLAGGWVTATFKELKDDEARVIGLVAKRARGMMARWIVDHRATRRDQLTDFAVADYTFDPALSSPNELVFTRPWRTAVGFT